MKYGFAVVLALTLGGTVACGGEQHEAHHGGEPAEHGKHHGGEPADHHGPKGPVGDFHAVLAPIWHADKSPERTAKMCSEAATLRERATAVEAAPAPAGVSADAAKAHAKQLTASVDALLAACAADGRPEVEAKFSLLHDAYHKVAGQAEGEHHH